MTPVLKAKLDKTLATAERHGDFYLYYNKYHGNGSTYLVGTTDFDNKYILKRATEHGSGLTEPLSGAVEQRLELVAKGANASGKVMVFSWTNNKFRFLDIKDVRRLTPLAAELRNAGKR